MDGDNVVLVQSQDVRPAGRPGVCFYCDQPLGSPHTLGCVIPQRFVKVRMTVEYSISVPRSWDAHMIEFHRNDSSWCTDNALDELEALIKEHGCLCANTTFTYLGEDNKNKEDGRR